MQQVNLHKQRLITVAIAALGLIFLFLPWIKNSAQGFQTSSNMGYVIWGGIICAIAFAAAIATSLLIGNKMQAFDKQGKLIAIIAFAAALLFTIIFLITASGTENQMTNLGYAVQVNKSAGIGAWLCLILEIGGLVFVSGILNKLMQQNTMAGRPASNTPPPPPPPKS
ncbi:MAG: hypothetical protein JST10_03265 [Bacteroidetes bacterium]|nr:hypothetical protein [Bacteroidota bacterium]